MNMPDDEDSKLKEAFAELHRDRREQAPAFAPMRESALQAADGLGRRNGKRFAGHRPVAMACAAVLVAAFIVWWMGARPASRREARLAPDYSVKRATQLLDQIEQHLALSDAPQSPAYPTDVLLIHSETEITP